ncbi:hypothetical protein ABH926_009794 [Catenulispora sp. GP43]|uniref:hypothetical protein n=1 Tax=Catenulispora sp. GP43 TaxID=3156263 RepID=UPI003517C8A7
MPLTAYDVALSWPTAQKRLCTSSYQRPCAPGKLTVCTSASVLGSLIAVGP